MSTHTALKRLLRAYDAFDAAREGEDLLAYVRAGELLSAAAEHARRALARAEEVQSADEPNATERPDHLHSPTQNVSADATAVPGRWSSPLMEPRPLADDAITEVPRG